MEALGRVDRHVGDVLKSDLLAGFKAGETWGIQRVVSAPEASQNDIPRPLEHLWAVFGRAVRPIGDPLATRRISKNPQGSDHSRL